MPLAMELIPRSLVMKMFINKKGIMKKELLPFTMISIRCKYVHTMSEFENIYKLIFSNFIKILYF